MKKYTFTFLIAMMWISLANAANSPYVEAMKKQINAMNMITSVEDVQNVKNGFLRIAEASPEEWLPTYYAALTLTNSAFRFEVDKDQYFEEAMTILKPIVEKNPDNSEITALHGYIVMGQLSVDPNSRGQELSGKAMQLFGKAIAQDRSNPRATSLMSRMEFGMAQFFGNGPEKACGMARMALGLFKTEKLKINEDYILPTWGEGQAQEMADSCK